MLWYSLNGQVVQEASRATVEAGDPGLRYGYGVFETVRLSRGRPLDLERHLRRLAHGAQTLAIPLPAGGVAALTRDLERLLERAACAQGQAHLTLTPGPRPGGPPTVLLSVEDHLPYRPEDYTRGFAAVTCPWPRNERSPLAGIKSLNYLENLLARRLAAQAGAEEALFYNTRGELAEGSRSNVFLVRDAALVTPPPQAGVLAGVTRARVLELATALGLPVREITVPDPFGPGTPEAFLTSSLLEVMPLVRVDGRAVGPGHPGPVTLRLLEAYQKWRSEAGGRRQETSDP